MKRIISISLVVLMVFSISASTSFAMLTDDSTYNTCDEIQRNIQERIDNYFLPAAYDISPFTVAYGGYFYDPGIECTAFYQNNVVYDQKGKISVPPIYSLIVTKDLYYNYNPPFYAAYMVHKFNNKNNVEMTPSMWRVLHTNNRHYTGQLYETAASVESVINAYIAPWTLYNNGNLYTWPEIMEMNEDELNSLDFASYEFYTFISGVKEALESRGWWKEEYLEKYDILNSHREDYIKAQPENEILEVSGKQVYLSRINQEYNGNGTVSLNNIISVNIYDEEFADAIESLDAEVSQRYQQLLSAIEKEYNTNRRDRDIKEGRKRYMEAIPTEAPPGVISCECMLTMLAYFINDTGEQNRYGYMSAISGIEALGLSDEEVKQAFAEYNYVAGDWGAFNFDVVNTVANNTKNENIDYFLYETSIVLNYEKNDVTPWWRVAAFDWDSGRFDDELSGIDDYDRVIARLEYLYNNYNSGEYKENFKNNIEYLKSYANKQNPPSTGENTILYIAIATAALAAMTALVVRRKRKIVL